MNAQMIASTGRFFGQYLLEKGRISNEQLIAVVDHQLSSNPQLGRIAVERGYLTEDQGKRVNAAQRTADRMFGDLAVELGFLTPEQLSELVEIQRVSRMFLGEAFVEKGILTSAEFNGELAAFRAEQQTSQRLIRGALMQLEGAEFVADVLDVVLKMFTRLVHDQVLIEDCHQDRGSWMTHDFTVSQRFTGDVDATFVMGLPEVYALRIASRLLEDEFTAPDERVLDAAKEFVNVICGNICAKLGGRDLNVEIKAPAIFDRHARPQLIDGYTVITSLTSIDAKLDVALVQHQ